MGKRRRQRTAARYDMTPRYVSGKKPLCIALVLIAVLAVCVSARISYVRKLEASYIEQEQQLEQRIAQEEARSEELMEYEEYMKTTEFVEEIAQKQLGLVYGDDIIFQNGGQ